MCECARGKSCVYLYICVCEFVRLCAYVCVCVCMCVRVCVCVRVPVMGVRRASPSMVHCRGGGIRGYNHFMSDSDNLFYFVHGACTSAQGKQG
jgi:hypothetical protein